MQFVGLWCIFVNMATSPLRATTITTFRILSQTQRSRHSSLSASCQHLPIGVLISLSTSHKLTRIASNSDFSPFISCFVSYSRPSATFPAKSLCVCRRATYWCHILRLLSTTVTDESTLAWFIFFPLRSAYCTLE